MGTVELKEKLINKINEIQDIKLLEEIFALIKLEQELHEEEAYILSSDLEKTLLKSYQEVKKGNFLTNDEANQEAGKW